MTAGWWRRHSRDVLTIVLLTAIGGAASWRASGLAAAAIDLGGGGRDRIWFGGEVADTVNRLTAPRVDRHRTLHHPLLMSVMRLPTRSVLRLVPSMEPSAAIRLGLAGATGVWIAGLFLVCRAIGCAAVDATLFALLGLTSAAVVFWSAVPERMVFSSVTILPAIALAAVAARRTLPEFVSVAVVAVTMSLTVTNAWSGLIATAMQHPWRRTVQVAANAICVILLLCGVQRLVFPSPGIIAHHDPADWPVLRSTLLTAPAEPLAPFFFHSMVMPDVHLQPGLSVQRSWPGSAGAAGAVALAAWAGLLIIGATSSLTAPVTRVRGFLFAALAGHLALRLVFGEETFLDAMSQAPLLISLAAIGSLGERRRIVLALAAVLLMTSAINNQHQLLNSIELARAIPVGSIR